MKVFLSSTFADLVPEREAVLAALRKKRMSTLAMEDFLATPTTPIDTALANLRSSDLMVLIIGSKAGSLLPDGSGGTYTSAEYNELEKLGKEALVFIKQQKRWWWSRRPRWRNAEKDRKKRKALDEFKARVGIKWTWDTFSTPDQLALGVIQSIDHWEARGRPGARSTFASATEYFASTSPTPHFQLLDFQTRLLGRGDEIRILRNFIDSPSQRVCILSGRGGIGKSKILHDWASLNAATTMFLKDEPLWHEDSSKEIPINTTALVVDDAHRQETFGRVLQLVREHATHRDLKLIVSTRPGSSTRLAQQIFRKFDAVQVAQFPELKDLSIQDGRALAEQVLGPEFRRFANHLAQIASNNPLVIVAGGRLIASRRAEPSTLTTLEEFRSTVFKRVLDEMDLHGPRFAIDPPTPVLDLLAALGPVDADSREFRDSATVLLNRPIDEVLATIDTLAFNGIVSSRGTAVRVVPDVLSDYILEERCIGSGGRSTGYADRVYEHFGVHSLKRLMRNLAELDWRLGQSGLNLLDDIWADIYQRFAAGDDYERNQILTDIAAAAIYQPHRVIALVRAAIDNSILVNTSAGGSLYRVGPDYVLAALPDLLEATARHPDCITESVTTLWELAKRPDGGSRVAKSAQAAIKRLASWHRFGNPALNFAMVVQAARLARRSDGFTGAYTPYAIIKEILERDGEFSEWEDETSLSIGGFGLNYAAVGPVRESALEYLEFALGDDGRPAFLAIDLLERLLHSFLNRVRRLSTEEEEKWQNRERQRCLEVLLRRLSRPSSALLKSRIYDAVRSATGVDCPDAIRERAMAALAEIEVTDDIAVIDAICTDDHELPRLTTKLDAVEWRRAIATLRATGRAALERLASTPATQARILIEDARACFVGMVKVGGLSRFLLTFTDRPDLLTEMYDQLVSHPQSAEVRSMLYSVLAAIHVADRAEFRIRALGALTAGDLAVIHAAASNLRVFDDATEEDVRVIHAYGAYPDPLARKGALTAIAFMGKFANLREMLKQAALAVRTDGDPQVTCELADAFGPYGVPLTSLSRAEAAAICSEFLLVDDWGCDQGTIPRFLNDFASVFPDETFDLLLRRIDAGLEPRQGDRGWIRTFGLVHGDVSFRGVQQEKRLVLAERCVSKLVTASAGAEEYAALFWCIVDAEEMALRLILNVAPAANEQGVQNISTLIEKAAPGLAFANPVFAKDLLRYFKGDQRQLILQAFACQARRIRSGLFEGRLEDHVAEQKKQALRQAIEFADEPGLEDLATAIRRLA